MKTVAQSYVFPSENEARSFLVYMSPVAIARREGARVTLWYFVGRPDRMAANMHRAVTLQGAQIVACPLEMP